jgi:hypothetical protein
MASSRGSVAVPAPLDKTLESTPEDDSKRARASPLAGQRRRLVFRLLMFVVPIGLFFMLGSGRREAKSTTPRPSRKPRPSFDPDADPDATPRPEPTFNGGDHLLLARDWTLPYDPKVCDPVPNATIDAGAMLLASARAACSVHETAMPADAVARGALPPAATPKAVPGGSKPPGGVSVVISAYMRFSTISMIVTALRRQKLVPVEIVMTDGGSWPPVLQQLPGLDVDTVIYSSMGRKDRETVDHRVRNFNEGVPASSYDTVILLDDNVVPASDFWAYAAMTALKDNPGASIVRMPTRSVNAAKDLRDAGSRAEEVRGLDWTGKDAIGATSTSNMLITKEAWKKLGGFDWAYDGKPKADADFHARAEAAGLKYANSAAYGCALLVYTA